MECHKRIEPDGPAKLHKDRCVAPKPFLSQLSLPTVR